MLNQPTSTGRILEYGDNLIQNWINVVAPDIDRVLDPDPIYRAIKDYTTKRAPCFIEANPAGVLLQTFRPLRIVLPDPAFIDENEAAMAFLMASHDWTHFAIGDIVPILAPPDTERIIRIISEMESGDEIDFRDQARQLYDALTSIKLAPFDEYEALMMEAEAIAVTFSDFHFVNLFGKENMESRIGGPISTARVFADGARTYQEAHEQIRMRYLGKLPQDYDPPDREILIERGNQSRALLLNRYDAWTRAFEEVNGAALSIAYIVRPELFTPSEMKDRLSKFPQCLGAETPPQSMTDRYDWAEAADEMIKLLSFGTLRGIIRDSASIIFHNVVNLASLPEFIGYKSALRAGEYYSGDPPTRPDFTTFQEELLDLEVLNTDPIHEFPFFNSASVHLDAKTIINAYKVLNQTKPPDSDIVDDPIDLDEQNEDLMAPNASDELAVVSRNITLKFFQDFGHDRAFHCSVSSRFIIPMIMACAEVGLIPLDLDPYSHEFSELHDARCRACYDLVLKLMDEEETINLAMSREDLDEYSALDEVAKQFKFHEERLLFHDNMDPPFDTEQDEFRRIESAPILANLKLLHISSDREEFLRRCRNVASGEVFLTPNQKTDFEQTKDTVIRWHILPGLLALDFIDYNLKAISIKDGSLSNIGLAKDEQKRISDLRGVLYSLSQAVREMNESDSFYDDIKAIQSVVDDVFLSAERFLVVFPRLKHHISQKVGRPRLRYIAETEAWLLSCTLAPEELHYWILHSSPP